MKSSSFKWLLLYIISFMAPLMVNGQSTTTTTINQYPKCVMGGACGVVETTLAGDLDAPCSRAVDPSAIKWNDMEDGEEVKENFRKLCPMLDIEGPLCCDHQQVVNMVNGIVEGVPKQLLGACPSCFANFAALYCAMSCSPLQGNYISVSRDIPSKDPPYAGARQVTAVNYTLHADWPDRLYSSCRDVSVAGLGPALTVMGCDEGCNGPKLVAALGTTDRSPFQVDYTFDTSSSGSMNVPTFGCDSSPTGSFDSFPCSCSDCSASCSKDPDDDCIDDRSSDEDVQELVSETRILSGSSLQSRLVVMTVTAVVIITLLLVLLLPASSSNAIQEPEVSWFTSFRRSFRRSSEDDTDPIIGPAEGDGHPHPSYRSFPERRSKEQNEGKLGLVERFLDGWTRICCRHPLMVITVAAGAIIAASCGLITIEMINDPVSLWSSPSSTGRIQKDFFDGHFGPFFRIQQVIFSSVSDRSSGDHFEYKFESDQKVVNVSNLFKVDLLKELLVLESDISRLSSTSGQFNGTTLDQICYAPLSTSSTSSGVQKCTIQSPLNYFQSNVSNLDYGKYLDHVRTCIKNPTNPADDKYNNVPCLGAFGGPGFPNVVFGGFDDPPACVPKNGSSPVPIPIEESVRILSSTKSLVLTFLVRNSEIGTSFRSKAESWEWEFLEHMKNFVRVHADGQDGGQQVVKIAGQRLKVSYYSERSVEDEIERQSRSDVFTIATSYLVMFGYVSLSLGQFVSIKRLFVDSKMALGLAGVLIVLASVSSSIGTTAYFGSKGTLIIVEVLPFLVLAVGVDNIFILVQAFQRTGFVDGDSRTTIADRMAATVVSVGPSILLSAAAESSCFLIGSFLSSMPAVNAFALNAAIALLISLLLQFSLFLSLFYLDTKRQLDGRIDLLFCFTTSSSNGSNGHDERIKDSMQVLKEASNKSRIQSLFSKHFVPFVATKSRCPRLCFTTFLIFTICWTLAIVPDLKVGLEQEISMPEDSYVLAYFKDQKSQLKVGAPVYFVLESASSSSSDVYLNYSSEPDQNLVCGGGSCSNQSLVSTIKTKSRQSKSRITGPSNSWLDDYFSWSSSGSCCRTFGNDSNKFCPSTLQSKTFDRSIRCKPCTADSTGNSGRPADFYRFLSWFLSDDPTPICAVGGHAQYSSGVNLITTDPVTNRTVVGSSWFMAYHKPAPNSDYFVASIIEARRLAASVEATFRDHHISSGAKVFPYSVFYVFYEQYLNIWKDTLVALSASMATILIVVLVSRLLGHVINSLIFLVTLTSFLIHLMGFMYWWNISLNALSLVNLVMAAGISVEFCSHVAVSFIENSLDKGIQCDQEVGMDDRTRSVFRSLKSTGSSVLSGITLTKLGGVIVLAFAKSKIFSIYYFRLYLGILILGAYHGLIVLPVLLSLFGRVKGSSLIVVESSSSQEPITTSEQEVPVQKKDEGKEEEVKSIDRVLDLESD